MKMSEGVEWALHCCLTLAWLGDEEAVPTARLAKGFELAAKIAANAPLSNFAVLHALPRIAEIGQAEGLFVESLMAAIASGDPAAKERIKAFLQGKAGKVSKG